MKNKKVNYALGLSIIIPTYNRPKLLDRALASIEVKETTKIEIIVIDDNSSLENQIENKKIINKYNQRYPIFYYINKINCGVSATRNYGISMSSKEWCLFLDDDDELYPGYLNYIFSILEKSPKFDIAWSNIISKNDFSGKITNKSYDINLFNITENFISIGIGYGVICKTELLLELNGFSELLKVAEDTELFIRVLKQQKQIAHLNTIGMIIHEDSENNLTRNFFRYAQEHVYKKIFRKHGSFFSKNKNLAISFSYWIIQVYLMHNKKYSAIAFAFEVLLRNMFYKPAYNIIRYTFENLDSFFVNGQCEYF